MLPNHHYLLQQSNLSDAYDVFNYPIKNKAF